MTLSPSVIGPSLALTADPGACDSPEVSSGLDKDQRFQIWWAAFGSRLEEVALALPANLEGTLLVEVWNEAGDYGYKSIRVAKQSVKLFDGPLQDDTACLSIRAADLGQLLDAEPSARPVMDLWGDSELVERLLATMKSAPKSTSLIGVRSSQ